MVVLLCAPGLQNALCLTKMSGWVPDPRRRDLPTHQTCPPPPLMAATSGRAWRRRLARATAAAAWSWRRSWEAMTVISLPRLPAVPPRYRRALTAEAQYYYQDASDRGEALVLNRNSMNFIWQKKLRLRLERLEVLSVSRFCDFLYDRPDQPAFLARISKAKVQLLTSELDHRPM